jgi:hypothetical protein
MPRIFQQRKYIPPKVLVCKGSDDLSFLRGLINSLQKLVTAMPNGVFPATLRTDVEFKSPASLTETISLSLKGTVMFLYQQLFSEPYPEFPSSIQQEKINAIWIGIGYPENVVPV